VRAALAVLRHCAALSFALLFGNACAPPPQGPLAGASDAWAKPPDVTRAPDPPPAAWEAYASVRDWPPMNAAAFTSRGHRPEQSVDIRVSPESRATYSALVSDSVFSDGSILVELSHTGEGHGYGMRKAAGNWTFYELNAQGGLLASGALPLCAGCHAQAPADSVFGLPREIAQPH
jgi:hypothetical protein